MSSTAASTCQRAVVWPAGPGQRVALVLEEPVEPEHADDEGAEGVAGGGSRAARPTLVCLDSMLSIRYRTHDSIMSYRRASRMDCRLELIAVPVSDVDRAIAFYGTRSASTSTTTTRSARSSASSS